MYDVYIEFSCDGVAFATFGGVCNVLVLVLGVCVCVCVAVILRCPARVHCIVSEERSSLREEEGEEGGKEGDHKINE